MSSSSGSSSSSAAALSAARQLSSLWKSRQAAKLLKVPPPAAFTGRAKDAVQESTRLLQLLSAALDKSVAAAAADEILQSMFQQSGVIQLLASLTAWLQQSPDLAAVPPCPAVLMWLSCMQCFMQLFTLMVGCASDLAGCAEQLTCVLDDAGALTEHSGTSGWHVC
jgi:hypothetical protein